ncbi:sugar ABC transporter permease [Paenibacillus thiaminolyticus]|uniref:Sugar ABC transporter permease n=1 Tax=Paenibacillus thiaminolyticus TaxID=49283 RepID=A0AAJ1G5Z9_PANTH|nr:sugar ABC transporter permease [Paenibacillus thiaminolyticus]MCY9534743.1 sugar ABC transporter permease [Paenibacillus thiaminolyticus]MCY9602076.1 sugar ABC transporter permease [Paenibacillus thiaminolyticus]MCY9608866.1 sugar ABC transporter permease [Paenibacillus thiaminolyticus]MCY9614920.1 sugar ABC transporter permease [Paenibacillus thiaminolyticus]MCY9618462.1 sugar ABC transporter permease [Paenibacillus thiaminolyticus]
MKKRKDRLWFALFTLPLLFIFTTVVVIPFLFGIAYSFVQWDGIPANPKVFVGLDNYIQLFQDERFLASAWHTLKFTILAVLIVNVFGLAFSLFVTTKLRVRNLARTMFFMPNLIGGLILGYIWQFIFTDAMGYIGESTGLANVFFNWLLDSQFALFALVVVFTWQFAGYTMIIYVAGLQGVPDELIEASKVDGANWWHRLTKITLPLLMPAFTICLFLTLSGAFKIYDVNLSLTRGGPNNATEMFAMNIFNEIFAYGNYGLGQAKAVLFFLVVAVFTLTQVFLTKKREVQY